MNTWLFSWQEEVGKKTHDLYRAGRENGWRV